MESGFVIAIAVPPKTTQVSVCAGNNKFIPHRQKTASKEQKEFDFKLWADENCTITWCAKET
jgi:hypothetical protein